jgi:hypothetical protein
MIPPRLLFLGLHEGFGLLTGVHFRCMYEMEILTVHMEEVNDGQIKQSFSFQDQ